MSLIFSIELGLDPRFFIVLSSELELGHSGQDWITLFVVICNSLMSGKHGPEIILVKFLRFSVHCLAWLQHAFALM